MTSRSIALIGCCVLVTSVPAARAQGSATSAAVSPRTIVAGGTVSVTVGGTNPCGAVRINYGDGDAITYAITGLPVTQTHAYQKVGNYTITAEGMGNCGGAPTTTLVVSAPPAPPPTPAPAPPAPATATIKAVEIAPTPGKVQEPVAVVARGTGTCAYEVRYGDGTSEQVDAQLPEETHHTYPKAGRYVVIVSPKPPCVGKFTQVLQVEDAAAQQPARITRIVASPSPGVTGQAIAIAVHGSGTCPYDVYYGDGSAEERDGSLPQSTRHVYAQPGRYAVVVKPHPPCTGRFTEMVQVAEATQTATTTGRIARVTAGPTPAVPGRPVRLTIDGSGACAFTIDYGDGTWDSRSMTLPGSLRHVYSAPGSYTVVVTPDDSQCRGSARVSFDVRRY